MMNWSEMMISVKEMAGGLNRSTEEILGLMEQSGMGAAEEDTILSNAQAMILFDQIRREKERRHDQLKFDRERQTLFNRLLSSDLIYMDTSTLLLPQVHLFWDRAETILSKSHKKIYIPFSVIRELWKHTDNPDKPELRTDAKQALERIEDLTEKDLVEVRGEESNQHADQSFMKLIEKYRFHQQILLITEDLDLSIDILNRNQTRSSYFIPVQVASLRSDGYLRVENLKDLEIRVIRKEAREKREEERTKREKEIEENREMQKNESGEYFCKVCGRDMTSENNRRIKKGKPVHDTCNRCYYDQKKQKKKDESGLENQAEETFFRNVKEQKVKPGFIGTAIKEHKGLDTNSKEHEQLRLYYNGWYGRRQEGLESARIYYRNLKALDDGLNQAPNKSLLCRILWKRYLSPAIHDIRRFDYDAAEAHLKGMTQWLAKELKIDLEIPNSPISIESILANSPVIIEEELEAVERELIESVNEEKEERTPPIQEDENPKTDTRSEKKGEGGEASSLGDASKKPAQKTSPKNKKTYPNRQNKKKRNRNQNNAQKSNHTTASKANTEDSNKKSGGKKEGPDKSFQDQKSEEKDKRTPISQGSEVSPKTEEESVSSTPKKPASNPTQKPSAKRTIKKRSGISSLFRKPRKPKYNA